MYACCLKKNTLIVTGLKGWGSSLCSEKPKNDNTTKANKKNGLLYNAIRSKFFLVKIENIMIFVKYSFFFFAEKSNRFVAKSSTYSDENVEQDRFM